MIRLQVPFRMDIKVYATWIWTQQGTLPNSVLLRICLILPSFNRYHIQATNTDILTSVHPFYSINGGSMEELSSPGEPGLTNLRGTIPPQFLGSKVPFFRDRYCWIKQFQFSNSPIVRNDSTFEEYGEEPRPCYHLGKGYGSFLLHLLVPHIIRTYKTGRNTTLLTRSTLVHSTGQLSGLQIYIYPIFQFGIWSLVPCLLLAEKWTRSRWGVSQGSKGLEL